jgi:hypothetical protein
MKKRLLALLCALTLMITPALGAEKSAYPDLAGDEWFYSAVVEMTQLGIMNGVEGGLFAPYEPVTRATIILVLWRLEGSPDAAVEEPFPDVEPWYETAAAWAKGYGIASGYDNGNLGGGDLLTREQLAVFLCNYATFKGEPLAEGALALFEDGAEVSSWAETAVRHVVGVGILQGGDGAMLNPQGTANRAALAVMLHRMLTPAVG